MRQVQGRVSRLPSRHITVTVRLVQSGPLFVKECLNKRIRRLARHKLVEPTKSLLRRSYLLVKPGVPVDFVGSVITLFCLGFLKLDAILPNTIAVFGMRTMANCMISLSAIEASSLLGELDIPSILLIQGDGVIMACSQSFDWCRVTCTSSVKDVSIPLEGLVRVKCFVGCWLGVKIKRLFLIHPFATFKTTL